MDTKTGDGESSMAERAFLSAIISDPDSFGEVDSLRVQEDDFQEFRHKVIFQHFLKLRAAGTVPDYITLSESLDRSGALESIGGRTFLVGIFDEYASSANVISYAEIIKKKSLFRDVVQKTKLIQNLAIKGNISREDLITECNKVLVGLNDLSGIGSIQTLKESILGVFKNITNRDSAQLRLTKTGFNAIDSKIVGLSPGQLVILAGRPSMGKTAIALNMVRNMAGEYNEAIPVFSIEMPNNELTERLISSDARVNSKKFKSLDFGVDDLKRISSVSETLSKLPILIDDNPSVSVSRIRSQCLRHKSKFGKLRAVVIDYLQLFPSDPNFKGTKSDEIGTITRELKLLSKEIECPIILLSQLNRSLESREDKRPMLQDLRSSGDIEQDADIVIFVYRDEFYNPGTKAVNEAEIIIAKNRGGETGTVKLMWNGEFTRFSDFNRP